jgi:hypothetical protein
MNGCVRALTCVAFFGIALTTLNGANPDWVRKVGLDFWNLPDLLKEQEACSRRVDELNATDKRLLVNCGGRARVVERVADGSMSLFEAAAAFRAMNYGSGQAVPDWFREHYPQASDEERLCRQVIVWSGNHLRVKGEPKRAAEVVARLEAVLEEQHREGRVIVLPPAKSP